MSEMEHHMGIAKKINIPSNLSVNEYAELLLKEANKEIADYYSNAIECLCDEFSEHYFYHGLSGNLYKLDNIETDDPDKDIGD